MKLELVRFAFGFDATIGILKLDSEPKWFVLEDEDRFAASLPKIAGKTAIPTGTFALHIKPWSPRFKRAVVELLEVPLFTDVYFHPGNRESETAGCPLPAMRAELASWRVINSRPAVEQIFKLVEKGDVTKVAITRGPLAGPELQRLKRRWLVDYLKKEGQT